MSWWGKWRREDASHRMLYAIITLTVVIFAAFFLIGYDHPFSENPDFKTVNRVPVALISTSVAVGTMLVMVVAFLLGSSSAISVNGKEYDQPTWLRVADMLVISALVLMVIATTAVAIATIRSHFKRK